MKPDMAFIKKVILEVWGDENTPVNIYHWDFETLICKKTKEAMAGALSVIVPNKEETWELIPSYISLSNKDGVSGEYKILCHKPVSIHPIVEILNNYCNLNRVAIYKYLKVPNDEKPSIYLNDPRILMETLFKENLPIKLIRIGSKLEYEIYSK